MSFDNLSKVTQLMDAGLNWDLMAALSELLTQALSTVPAHTMHVHTHI